MNGIARFFIILLRIAIGWHFFFEGIDKVESMRRGVTETSRPFSSAGYLNEASGPASKLIKEQIGDPDRGIEKSADTFRRSRRSGANFA